MRRLSLRAAVSIGLGAVHHVRHDRPVRIQRFHVTRIAVVVNVHAFNDFTSPELPLFRTFTLSRGTGSGKEVK